LACCASRATGWLKSCDSMGLTLSVHHFRVGRAGFQDLERLSQVKVASVGETQPFRHHNAIKAEHQIDDELSCVTAADCAEKEHLFCERAK
jgi:hypothetical protein